MAVGATVIPTQFCYERAEVLDALATGVLLLGPELQVDYANASAQQLLGVSFNLIRGRAWRELLKGPEELDALLHRALERAETCWQREVAIRPSAPTAEERVVDVIATPFDEDGGRKSLIVEIADATQRQRISRETQLLAQLGGSRLMVRQLAHEIKNPLGGLRGAAQLLERALKDTALREYTNVIISEADRLTNLVDSMLGPGRPPRRESLNVHELCEHVYHLMRSEASTRVVVERDYDPSLPSLALDRHLVIQAMLNLGRNALQAVGTQGRVVLRTRALTNASIGSLHYRLVASVEFEDNGAGVPPALRDSLFYPLVTGRAEGTGLGLAIAQDLVTRHGGLIEFESAPGRTIFTILLPIDADESKVS
jgi:two-component system nitrogen regulation sensor histidine kinase GlnL